MLKNIGYAILCAYATLQLDSACCSQQLNIPGIGQRLSVNDVANRAKLACVNAVKRIAALQRINCKRINDKLDICTLATYFCEATVHVSNVLSHNTYTENDKYLFTHFVELIGAVDTPLRVILKDMSNAYKLYSGDNMFSGCWTFLDSLRGTSVGIDTLNMYLEYLWTVSDIHTKNLKSNDISIMKVREMSFITSLNKDSAIMVARQDFADLKNKLTEAEDRYLNKFEAYMNDVVNIATQQKSKDLETRNNLQNEQAKTKNEIFKETQSIQTLKSELQKILDDIKNNKSNIELIEHNKKTSFRNFHVSRGACESRAWIYEQLSKREKT